MKLPSLSGHRLELPFPSCAFVTMRFAQALNLHRKRRRRILSVSLLIASFNAGSCSILLPANPHSEARDAEKVSIQFFDSDYMREHYNAQYHAAFGMDVPKPPIPGAEKGLELGLPAVPSLPSAIDIAAGFAIDFVAAQLKTEATEYEAQFTKTAAGDNFWILDPTPQRITTYSDDRKTTTTIQKTAHSANGPFIVKQPVTQTTLITRDQLTTSQFKNLVQHYYGFEVKRTVRVSSCAFCQAQEGQEAFDLVVGIAPSHDQQMFLMAPIFFREPYAKAKVLSDRWWTWLELWTWPGKVIKTPGHTINATATISVTAYWKDKNQQLQVDKVAAFAVHINGYDIDNPKTLEGSAISSNEAVAWLPALPVSSDGQGNPIGRGTFTVSVLVDDKDASNSQQYLEQAADLIEKQKPNILQLLPSDSGSGTSPKK